MATKGYIPVFVGPREYRIKNTSVHGNIECHQDGRLVETLCVAPQGTLPSPDVWAAQLLWLRHAEGELRERANITKR